MTTTHSQMRLFPSGAPELVRSNQKDRFYTDHINSLLSDISRQFLPLRLWLRWQREIQLLAELGYYALTTVIGNQTLGEEYCNIIQVGTTVGGQYKAPGFIRRVLAIIIQTIGVYGIEKLLELLYKRIRERNLGSLRLSEEEYDTLEKIVGFVEDVFTGVSQLHLAFFYIYGFFYHFGKRIAGVRYLMVRYSNASVIQGINSQLTTYRVLGWLIVLQLGIQIIKLFYRLLRKRRKRVKIELQPNSEDTTGGGLRITLESSKERQSRFKCPLCLEKCVSQSATTCGHIFCWSCISDWTSEKSECPVCRTTIHPQQLICLQYFSP